MIRCSLDRLNFKSVIRREGMGLVGHEAANNKSQKKKY